MRVADSVGHSCIGLVAWYLETIAVFPNLPHVCDVVVDVGLGYNFVDRIQVSSGLYSRL